MSDQQPKEPVKPQLHQLDADDLRRMNVPEEFWTVGSSGLPTLTASVKPIVRNYLANFDEMVRKGVGLMLLGGPGVGKTATAVAVLKAARERFKTGYFIRAAELRESLREQHSFDADISVMERCRAVDFLVIDDFGENDLSAPWFKLDDLTELVVGRGQRRHPTLITSGLNKARITAAKPVFWDKVGTYLPDFLVEGPDRRAAVREQLRAGLTKGES